MKFKLALACAMVCIYAALPVSKADEKPSTTPIVVAIPQAEQKAIIDAYKVVVDANKDLQIAMLKARVKCKVDETWQIDLQTMSFTPPAPAKAEPAKP